MAHAQVRALRPESPSRQRARPTSDAPPHRWLTLAVLCVPLLIVSLDNTVLNVVLPTRAGALVVLAGALLALLALPARPSPEES
jgi:hypothetical protein